MKFITFTTLICAASLVQAVPTIDPQLNPRLWKALDDRDADAISALLSKQTIPDVNALRDERQQITPLIEAAQYGLTAIAQALIKAGADLNKQNCWGNTALIEAVSQKQSMDIALLLINARANPNIQNCTGNTAFHYAVLYNRPSGLIDALLATGANASIKNNKDQTALDQATPHNKPTVRRSIALEEKERFELLEKIKSADDFKYQHLAGSAPQKKTKPACCIMQ